MKIKSIRQITNDHLNPQRKIRRSHVAVTSAALLLGFSTSLSGVIPARADTVYHAKGCLGPVHKHITAHGVHGGILYETADPIHPVDSRGGTASFQISYTYCPNEAKEGIKKLRSVRGCITWDNARTTTDYPHSLFYEGLQWRFTVKNDPELAAHAWRYATMWYMRAKNQTQQCTNWQTASASDVQWVGTRALMQYSASVRAFHNVASFDGMPGIHGGWWILYPSRDHKIW